MTDNNEMLHDAERRRPGRPKSPVPEVRLHVSMPQSLKERLEQIMRDTHASSVTEVVKNSLVLYAASLEVHNKGGCVVFKDENGGERQLNLFL